MGKAPTPSWLEQSGIPALILLALLLILALHLLHLRHYYFLTDDAFISFRYVYNWVQGQGLVFNPGERVEGYTNFLWVVLLAPFDLLELPPEKVAPVLSILASLAAMGVVFFFPRLSRQEEQMRPAWLLAPLLLALNRSWAVWATSGLETRLCSLLLFLGAIWAWRTSQNQDPHDPIWTGVFFGLAELCRPETPLFFAVAGGLILGLRWLGRRKLFALPDLVGMAIFLGILAAHYGGRRLYYEMWLPNTYYAKVGQPWWDMGFRYWGVFVLEYSYWLWLPVVALAGLRAWRVKNFLPAFLILFPFPYMIYLTYLGGDHFEYRFLDPVLPFLALLFQECLRTLAGSSRTWRQQAGWMVFFLGFLIYSTALPWASGLGFPRNFIESTVPPFDFKQAPWLQILPGIKPLSAWHRQIYAEMLEQLVGNRAEEHRLFTANQINWASLFQTFLKKGYLMREEVLGLTAVGIIPYYTPFRVVDYHGLTDATVARSQPAPGTQRRMFHDKEASFEYMQSRQVDYFLIATYLRPVSSLKGLPAIRRDPPNFSLDRYPRYLVKMGDWYFIFYSPQDPHLLLERFEKRGLPIYLYVLHPRAIVPVPLSQALDKVPRWNQGRPAPTF